MSKRILFLVLLFSGLYAVSMQAQVQGTLGKRFTDNWSVGIGGGPNVFFGDLKNNQFLPDVADPSELVFGGTFTLTKQLSHVFALRGQLLYSELAGKKEKYTDGSVCNEYFNGNVLEWSIGGTINFNNLFSSSYKPKRKFFVFGSLGVGTASWITNVKDLTTHDVKRKSDDLDLWTTKLSGTGSLGMYYSIHEKVNLGLEWSLHAVNSDELDVSRNHFKYDAYSMVAFTITYNFNKYNPGKEPDTNRNKIFVPVYIQQPAPEVKPVDTTPKKPVVIEKAEPLFTDTTDYVPMLTPADADTEALFREPGQTGEFYRVQIFAFKNDRFTAEEVKTKYNLEEPVYKDFSDDWYRYTVGACSTYNEAKTLKVKMRKKGFKGAFITKYNNGIRVSGNE